MKKAALDEFLIDKKLILSIEPSIGGIPIKNMVASVSVSLPWVSQTL